MAEVFSSRPKTRNIVPLMVGVSLTLSTLTLPALAIAPHKIATIIQQATTETIRESELIGPPTPPTTFTPRHAKWESEFVKEGAVTNIGLPMSYHGEFPVPPLRALHFNENGVGVYAYLFPAGQAQQAERSVSGDGVMVRWGDVLVIGVGGGVSGEMLLGVARGLAPSCDTTGNVGDKDFERNPAYGTHTPLNTPITISANTQEWSTPLSSESTMIPLPEAFINELATHIGNTEGAPPHPGEPPTPPALPSAPNTFHMLMPDTVGPGCGWDYTGAWSPATGANYIHAINNENQARKEQTTQAFTDDNKRFVKELNEFARAWSEWEAKKNAWVKWQSLVIDEYRAVKIKDYNGPL